jgi:hypothetical protein
MPTSCSRALSVSGFYGNYGVEVNSSADSQSRSGGSRL